MKRVILGCLLSGTIMGTAEARLPQVEAQTRWKVLLKQGDDLAQSASSSQRVKGANILLRAYQLAPGKLRTMAAASRACMLLGFETRSKSKMRYWGERGWKISKQMIRRWPKSSEGYTWAAIHVGLIAQGSSHASVFFRGLHIQIENMAKASVRINPVAHGGIGHRILGRYYYMLPWPMRNLKKSLKHLRTSYILSSYDANTQLFYADTLWAKGQKRKAKAIYRSCAKKKLRHALRSPVQISGRDAILKCRAWLRKHR